MPPRKSRKTPKRSKHPIHHSKSRPTKPTSGPAFEQLVSVMSRLRSPNGCPWDREQTHSTLRTYLIEEAYEVLDALDSADDAKFAEELGDLLLQVLFHAEIASEENRFTISDVIREIHEKMIRRHPHVFGTARAKTAADVLHNWEIIKREEQLAKTQSKGVNEPKDAKQLKEKSPASASESFTSSTSSPSSTSILDGVPRTLPALLEAFQLTRKAARIGFDWDHVDGIFAKLHEESAELQEALASQAAPGAPPSVSERGSSSPSHQSPATSHSSIESELGDLLFVVVNLARFLHIDPEIALKKTSSKFSRRFHTMERLAREQGTTLVQVPRPQLESLWDQAKLLERKLQAP
jgi:MazG family protein